MCSRIVLPQADKSHGMERSPELSPEIVEVGSGRLQQAAAEPNDDETSGINTKGEDESSRLKALTTEVRDQNDLERDIGRQVGETD